MSCSIRLLSVHSPEDVERELAAIDLDPFSIRNLGPKMLHRLLLLEKIGIREGNLLKQALLSLGGDAAIAGRKGEREPASVSVILMGTDKQLRRLCQDLSLQTFGLPSFAADLLRLLDTMSAPPRSWTIATRSLDLSCRPCVMGVINVTPDSFSDGNRFLSPENAVKRALEMEQEGADIIDIGGESTRPGADPVSSDEELQRIMPVLEKLSGRLTIPLSIDTFKSVVAREALAAGAEIINDISGLTFDERMADVIAESRAGLVVMHTRGRPVDMQNDTEYRSLLTDVIDSLRTSLLQAEAAGISADRIVIDPGIGFGKSTEGNLELLRRLPELSVLGRPVLVGTSRKSFIGTVLNRPHGERLFGTAATVAVALSKGAAIFRVHDVRAMRDVVDMTKAILGVPA
jgi:dihydropteroate synthase